MKGPAQKGTYAGIYFCRNCIHGQGETCRNRPGELLSKCLGAVSQSQDPAASAAAPIPPFPSLCLGRMEREEHILDLQTPIWKVSKSSFHPLLLTGSVKFWFYQGWMLNLPKLPVSVRIAQPSQGRDGGENKERAQQGVASAE